MPPDPGDALSHLPHRDPFRFITRMISLSPGERGEALWQLTGREDFFRGHFPGDPIVPGVLITEALAQLSGLVGIHGSGSTAGRLVHTDIRFDNAARPPGEIRLRSSLSRSMGPLRQFEVAASVQETPVARGTLTLAAVDQQSGA